jgi:hypothetical protein
MSELSRLSVQQAVVGQSAVVVRRPGFMVNTSILDRNAFTVDYIGETDVGVSISLPTNLFAAKNLNDPDQILTRTIEVMHAVFDESFNLLPGANGPILMLEIRQRGQGQSIDFFSPIAKPITLSVRLACCVSHLCGLYTGVRACVSKSVFCMCVAAN